MAMEDLELTDAQAQALLDSPTPLADVYRHFEKLETGYMDVIRDSIENRADDVCKVWKNSGPIPLYLHSARLCVPAWEMAQYNRSYQANFDCKEALNTPSAPTMRITDWIRSLRLRRCWKSSGRNEYSSSFANTIQHKDSDGRVSRDNKAWQRPFPCRRTAALRATVLIWLWMRSILV